jgi:hypothetical protein
MEHEHGPTSRKHLEAFASLMGVPGASRVEEDWNAFDYGPFTAMPKRWHEQGSGGVEMSRGVVSKTPPSRVWSESDGKVEVEKVEDRVNAGV